MKQQFYVVWAGLIPGVYDNWNETERQVKGYPGAKYAGGFATRAEAEAAFNAGYYKWVESKKKKSNGGPPLY